MALEAKQDMAEFYELIKEAVDVLQALDRYWHVFTADNPDFRGWWMRNGVPLLERIEECEQSLLAMADNAGKP